MHFLIEPLFTGADLHKMLIYYIDCNPFLLSAQNIFSSIVLRTTYLLTVLSAFSSVPFEAAVWSHCAFSQFFQCNRSFQQRSSLCLMLLYCLDPATAKSCLSFLVFVVTPKTLEVEWAVKQRGDHEGWVKEQVKYLSKNHLSP